MSDEPERLDAPNQQVVRADGSGPADQGSGGSAEGSAERSSGRRTRAGRSTERSATPSAETEATEDTED